METPVSPVPEEPRKNNTTLIIVAVIVLVLCCCCLVSIPIARWLWYNGDSLFGTGAVLQMLF
ncbi:MAG: hypothetical protein ACM3PS_09900 [Syntrophothermus sp.]